MTAQPEDNDTPDMTPEEAAAFAQWFEDYADAENEAKKLAVKLGYVEKTATTGVDDAEKKADRVEALQVQINELRSGYGADIIKRRRETSAPEMSETAPTPAPAAPVVAGIAPDLDHCPPTPQAEAEANGTVNEAPQPVPAAPPEAVLMPQPSPLDTPAPELTPTPQPEPAQPLPPSPAVPVVAESWHLKKPERAHGYTWELYSVLKAARDAGKTCPKPREVLDSWQAIKPPNITEVMSDEFKYLDSNGEIKTADLKALRKAIDRMRSAR